MQVSKQNMQPVASTTPSSAAPPVESQKQSTVQHKLDPRIPSGEALAQKWADELNRNALTEPKADEKAIAEPLDELIIPFMKAQRAKFPPGFNLKEWSRQVGQEALANLNRNVVLDAEVDEAIRSQLSAKEWTQAKAEKIAAKVRAAQAKRAPD